MEFDLNIKEQERLSAILTSTIGSLCRSGMINSTVARVDGILGITLASNTVFLVKIQEQLCETEICRQPSGGQSCNNSALNNVVGTIEPQTQSELCHLVISDVQEGVLMPPSEPVENDLTNNREVGVVLGVQATDAGTSSCPPNHVRAQISAFLQKRKKYKKPFKTRQPELDELEPSSLEEHEENKQSQDGEEMYAVYEPHRLEDLSNALCNDTGSSASAFVKMECLSEDELTRSIGGPSQETSQVNQSKHFKSRACFYNGGLSDTTRVTPQVVINTQEVRTIRRVGRPRKDRTTSQVVSRRTAISKGSLSTSLVDFSPSGGREYLPKLKPLALTAGSKRRRRTYTNGYTRDVLTIAVNKIMNNTLSFCQASKIFGVPQTTLRDSVRRLQLRN